MGRWGEEVWVVHHGCHGIQIKEQSRYIVSRDKEQLPACWMALVTIQFVNFIIILEPAALG